MLPWHGNGGRLSWWTWWMWWTWQMDRHHFNGDRRTALERILSRATLDSHVCERLPL